MNAKNYIYVLYCNDAVKVGRSNNPKERIKGHRTSNPWVQEIKVYEAPEWGEKYIHHRLDEHLKNGCTEWFNYYEGIYSDIDQFIKEVLVMEVEKQENIRIALQQQKVERLKASPYKVFKFKDVARNDYAFIITKTKSKAEYMIKRLTFLNVEFVEKRDLDVLPDAVLNAEYIYKSDLRTFSEYEYCKENKINFNREYGISVPRVNKLKTKDNYSLPNLKRKSSTFTIERRMYYA